MDTKKMGSFLKRLRKERGLTQEEFAEVMNVSNRTISRWETGNNSPDLDVLLLIAEYYNVDLKEILDGERKEENMDKELEKTVIKVADYSNMEKEKLTKRMHYFFMVGSITFVLYFITLYFEPQDSSNFFDFFQGLFIGISFGTILVGSIMTSKYMSKIYLLKGSVLKRRKNQK